MTLSDFEKSFQHPKSSLEQIPRSMLHALPNKPFKMIGEILYFHIPPEVLFKVILVTLLVMHK